MQSLSRKALRGISMCTEEKQSRLKQGGLKLNMMFLVFVTRPGDVSDILLLLPSCLDASFLLCNYPENISLFTKALFVFVGCLRLDKKSMCVSKTPKFKTWKSLIFHHLPVLILLLNSSCCSVKAEFALSVVQQN